jgi:hypothetical protein
MGLIFRKRIKVAPNTAVNLSRHGASVSERVGPVTVNTRGRVTVRLLPGLTFRLGSSKGKRRR